MKTLKFRVTARVPDEVTAYEMKAYIHSAVVCWGGWGGQFHHPLFGLHYDQIEVAGYRTPKSRRGVDPSCV
jgi:hypothetical protein